MLYLTGVFLIIGMFFFFTGTVGFLRFPDFYTRMHATGKGDTLALFFFIVGFIIYELWQSPNIAGVIQSVKLASIAAFWFLASPTATHSLLRSAFESGVRPWTRFGRIIIEKQETKEGE